MRECNICFEKTRVFFRCKRCVYDWCSDCHTHLNKCPYCRKSFRIRSRRRRNIPHPDLTILNLFGLIQAFVFLFFMISVLIEIQDILSAI